MTEHVVLVGLSGTGKTSVGRRIAALLGRAFVDADEEIEARTGRTVRGIFADDGEVGFREVEAKVMADLLGAPEPSVIASGGGAVVTESTRRLLQQPDVFVVWLTAAPAFLASRTKQKPHRPLLDGDPIGTLTRLLEERSGWYGDVADATYDVQPAHRAAPKPEAKDNIARTIAGIVRDRDARRSRDHVVLIGPMGSGKTTVGRLVAAALGRPLVDNDVQLSSVMQHSAREIADAEGLTALHQLELDALRSALASTQPSVITAAASTVDEVDGRIALESAHDVVFLRIDPQLAIARSASGAHRPEVARETATRRTPLYESVATAVVDVSDLDAESVAQAVLSSLGAAHR